MTEYAELPLIPTTGQDMARERGRLHGAGAKLGPKPQAWVVQYRRRAVQVDLAAGAAAAALGIAIRFGDEPRSTYVLLGVTMPFAWLGLVFLAKGYERRFLGTGTEEYRSLTRAAVGLLAVIALISYAWQLELARGFVLLACPAVLTFDLLGRWLLRRWLKRQRMAGRCMQRTVVVGRADSTAVLIRDIRNAPSQGLNVVAACVSGLGSPWDAVSHLEDVPVFGRPEQALHAVDIHDADVVAISSHPDLVGQALRRLAWALEERNVELVISPGILDVAGPRLSIRPAAGTPLLHVERPVSGGAPMLLKGLVDRVVALALMVLALPVLLAVAVAVKLTSPGPVLFTQNRVGARGEVFTMFKFRTMVVDAERLLSQMKEDDGHEVNTVLFKKKDDPRITRIGKVLRRYSVDELPQLLNVIRGRHVVDRAPTAAGLRGREVRVRRHPPPPRPARSHRPVAGQRTQRPHVGGVLAPRPLVRRQLVLPA